MEDILVKAARAGVQFRADGDELRVTAPQGALTEELRQGLRLHKREILKLLKARRTADEPLPVLQPDFAHRDEPFPLTDLQHAYWLGRDSSLEMGNVATHLYVELDCAPLDLPRLNNALCQLIDRHDMLRAIVDRDGQQRILPVVPRYEIPVEDRSSAPPQDVERTIDAVREALSHQVLKADQWPLFEIRATLLPASRVRLHVSLDLLILDAWSIFLFFQEWHRIYEDGGAALPALGVSFRDYVVAERRLQESEAYKKSYAYWMDRVDSLPPAPELPLRTELSARQSPRFSRREARLPKAKWEKLKASARASGLTPSGLLLAAYSEVLARWSATPHFTLNVTISNRLPLHKDVNHLLGDFTSLVMQEVDLRDTQSTFVERARRLQQQFLTDLDHREVSGVTVLREWAKRRGSSLQAAMPVVFSSGLIWTGVDEVGDLEQFGRKVYSVSQTSQVWLDHHVMELNSDLVFIWDAADAVFEPGVLDAMFSAYCELIEQLADDESQWKNRFVVQLPNAMALRREQVNHTIEAVTDERIHAGFVRNALARPEAVAVIASERTLTYGDLLREGSAVADWLIARDLPAGQPVAVLMHKGWEQIVAVYGILLAGGAYLPIDADLPMKRQRDLLRIGEVQQVLTQPGVAEETLASNEWAVRVIEPGMEGDFDAIHGRSLQRPTTELAYVIFTSGTTGVPKGVMIDHRGAVNTIEHINRLFKVGADDRVLAVSSLSFDLSVYDIFGLGASGGALVVPDYRKGHDPVHWRELILRHGVTVWNSAPQLMRMLMDSFYLGENETADLRTVLLSGDFIPLDLPDRIRKRYTEAEVISLGGATEASIWSIYHPVGAVDPSWASIPYGRPLPNQTIWVYDRALRPCPDFVKGRIFIGGAGLALGYWRDAEKTAARFITHPETGERLYDTGDLGRYASDGNVVILGRDDGQLKIRGHRIELGEIEAVLRLHPDVKQVVVLPTPGERDKRQLVAYVEVARHGMPAAENVETVHPGLGNGSLADQTAAASATSCSLGMDTEALRQFVAERLPDYMVPRHVIALARLPVSANGKIDYRSLPPVTEEELEVRPARVAPRNEWEQTILDTWSRIITGCEIGVTDNFFELGGDSVLATQLIRELNTALPVKLEMHELFENLTIESLATLVQTRIASPETDRATSSEDSAHVKADGPTSSRDVVLADVRAAIDTFSVFDFTTPLPAPVGTPRALFITGATGWIGAHLLAELLTLTEAKIYCLVRATDEADAQQRLVRTQRQWGIELPPTWSERVVAVHGDLRSLRFGLSETQWASLTDEIDGIFHLGASVNVVNDYGALRATNVGALVPLVQLAVERRRKPVHFFSPMAIGRRFVDGKLAVHYQELPQPELDGLLTGYSQSKWAAEQVLLAAAEKGLPVTIYRTSHALPSARLGLAKPNYTFGSVLQTACAAGVVPEWPESALTGVPVDTLARLIAEDALARGRDHSVVHVENRSAPSLPVVIETLLKAKGLDPAALPRVSLEAWKQRCLEATERLPSENATLARVLFTQRGAVGTGVETMFGIHPIDTTHFARYGQSTRLEHLTPASYWEQVARQAGW